MPTLLITGANRGLGYALAEAYANDGWDVIATSRSEDAKVPANCQHRVLDLADLDAITEFAEQLGDQPIDLLWNNAGIYPDKNLALDEISNDTWMSAFMVNSLAPVRIAAALQANVARSEQKLMVFTSTIMSSLSLNGSAAYAYRSSKAALNMAVRCLAKDYEATGICTLMLHPGHVRTEMGGAEGAIDITTSINGMRDLIAAITPQERDQFHNSLRSYDGSVIPW